MPNSLLKSERVKRCKSGELSITLSAAELADFNGLLQSLINLSWHDVHAFRHTPDSIVQRSLKINAALASELYTRKLRELFVPAPTNKLKLRLSEVLALLELLRQYGNLNELYPYQVLCGWLLPELYQKTA